MVNFRLFFLLPALLKTMVCIQISSLVHISSWGVNSGRDSVHESAYFHFDRAKHRKSVLNSRRKRPNWDQIRHEIDHESWDRDVDEFFVTRRRRDCGWVSNLSTLETYRQCVSVSGPSCTLQAKLYVLAKFWSWNWIWRCSSRSRTRRSDAGYTGVYRCTCWRTYKRRLFQPGESSTITTAVATIFDPQPRLLRILTTPEDERLIGRPWTRLTTDSWIRHIRITSPASKPSCTSLARPFCCSRWSELHNVSR